ncbi:MAG: hypothetical protein K2N54_04780 [Helicobacter sp.]|nr:hypothetical protein [Helicobacter sp.]
MTIGGAVLTAHKRESHTKSATKVAPPNKILRNRKRFQLSLRASGASVAINGHRIPTMRGKQTRLIAARLKPLAMTIGTLEGRFQPHKISESRANQNMTTLHLRCLESSDKLPLPDEGEG